jgi:hypothetical protein
MGWAARAVWAVYKRFTSFLHQLQELLIQVQEPTIKLLQQYQVLPVANV